MACRVRKVGKLIPNRTEHFVDQLEALDKDGVQQRRWGSAGFRPQPAMALCALEPAIELAPRQHMARHGLQQLGQRRRLVKVQRLIERE